MARYEGECPECGKTHFADRKGEIVTCDCWRTCQTCGAEMTPYQPDLAVNTYGFGVGGDLAVLMICALHIPSFFSKRKPVEVVCT